MVNCINLLVLKQVTIIQIVLRQTLMLPSMFAGLRVPFGPGVDGGQRVGGRVQRRLAAPLRRLQGTALQHAAKIPHQV